MSHTNVHHTFPGALIIFSALNVVTHSETISLTLTTHNIQALHRSLLLAFDIFMYPLHIMHEASWKRKMKFGIEGVTLVCVYCTHIVCLSPNVQ